MASRLTASAIGLRRVYDPPSPEDGTRILVDRLWPRGLKKEKAQIDEWLRDVAPSTALRQWFAHRPERWDEFRARYAAELATQKEAVDALRRLASQGHATLLFAARDVERNNAVALRHFLIGGLRAAGRRRTR
jgi:uncharacterized protein YeaO (DUF488 family)